MRPDGSDVTRLTIDDLPKKYYRFVSWTAAVPEPTGIPTPTLLTRGPYAISAGYEHTCVLLADGAPACWGADEHGQSTPPPDEKFVAISSGSVHTCALRKDGSPVCWGSNRYGEASPPQGEKFIDISGGTGHTCALREDGSPVCWGNNWAGQASPPPGETFTAIASTFGYTCGIRKGGDTLCWGETEDRTVIRLEELKLVSISGGSSDACGMTTNRLVLCWHKHSGEIYYTEVARELSYLGTHTSDAYVQYRCGIRPDGSVLCWWSDRGGTDVVIEQIPPGKKFTSITTGERARLRRT